MMDLSEAKKVIGQSLDALKKARVFENLPAALEYLQDETDGVKTKRSEMYELEEEIARLKVHLENAKQEAHREQKALDAAVLNLREKNKKDAEAATAEHKQIMMSLFQDQNAILDVIREQRAQLESIKEQVRIEKDSLARIRTELKNLREGIRT